MILVLIKEVILPIVSVLLLFKEPIFIKLELRILAEFKNKELTEIIKLNIHEKIIACANNIFDSLHILFEIYAIINPAKNMYIKEGIYRIESNKPEK